jgi:predicted MPP superfamily phosphohydrolase
VISRVLFALFVFLALLGDARIFLFIMNHVVFGSHRHEKSPWHFLMYVTPPVLMFLTVKAYVIWLTIAASVGAYWIFERIRANVFAAPPLVGIRELPSKILSKHSLNQAYDIEVTRNEIFIDDLDETLDGYRIAFLTDTHVAPAMPREFYDAILAQLVDFDPHLVLLGGDFITRHKHIPLLVDRLIGRLHARDGILAVLGNHDYWAGADAVMSAMTNVRFLTNESAALPLPIVGIDEMYRGSPDPDRAFASVGAAGPCIAISHHPDIIDVLGGRRIDLLLCGHTHGGQIRFPFFGAVVVPSRHETEFASGFHRVRGVLMYVSRGIGSIPPLRILCRPEVATFVLRRGHRTL